jgi:RecB family exonuclease
VRDTPTEQLGFDGMPEKLFVCTPSKLVAYEDCPRRYRYAYVDRPAPAKGPAWAHNSLGASVHTALRNWYGLPPQRRRPEALATLLKATWVSEGYRDDSQEREAFRQALTWLEGYVSGLDPLDEPVGVERTVGAKTALLALSGRVDRIDRRGDELVIVDYKTGRSELSSDDARGSRALALYAYAAERVFRRRCRKVELHHLPTGTVAGHEHSEQSLTRQVSRAEDTARDILAAERAVVGGADPDTAFPTAPGALCSWCDYRRACPAGQSAPAKEPWAGLLRDAGGAGEDPSKLEDVSRL